MVALAGRGACCSAALYAVFGNARRGHGVDRGGVAGVSPRHFAGAARGPDVVVLADADLHFREPVSADAARAPVCESSAVRAAGILQGAVGPTDASRGGRP